MGELAVLGSGRVGSVVVSGALGLEMEHRRNVQQQGQAARAQLIRAMQITSTKLHQIHKRVQGTL